MGRSTAHALPPAVVEWVLTQLPIPKDCESAWVEVERSKLGERQQVALRLVAAGMRVTAAAEAVGLANHADLSRNLRRFGFEPADRTTLGQEFRRIAGLGMHEWQRRLEEEPEKIPTNLLQVGVGIATDKVAKAEGWETRQEVDQHTRLNNFFNRIGNAPRVSLEVEPRESIEPQASGRRAPRDAM